MTSDQEQIPHWLSMLPEDVARAILSGKPVDHAAAVAAWKELSPSQCVALMRDLDIFVKGAAMGASAVGTGVAIGLATLGVSMQKEIQVSFGNIGKFVQLSPLYGRHVWETNSDPLGDTLRAMGMNGNESQ